MASVIKDKDGSVRLQWGPRGSRKTLYLGKIKPAKASTLKAMIESIVSSQSLQSALEPHVASWIGSLNDEMHTKLSSLGLFSARGSAAVVMLETLVEKYKAFQSVKASTARSRVATFESLLTFMGPSRDVRTIKPVDADAWRTHLRAIGLAQATISKRVKTARMLFKRAMRWEFVESNAFAEVSAGTQANPGRQRFITQAMADKVLEACPDAQWRLIFALSRYAGLRCPSETLGLRWEDVNWHSGIFIVRENKTKQRVVPIFPELRRYLLEAFEDAAPGTQYAVSIFRSAHVNMRTQFKRIIQRAGLVPWPKLFHNLRSTRQTELTEFFPNHVVCAWLGNSERIAKMHYLQTTDAYVQRAVATETAHKTAHATAELSGIGRNAAQSKTPETAGNQQISGVFDASQVTPTGSEHFTNSRRKTTSTRGTSAQTSAQAQSRRWARALLAHRRMRMAKIK